MAASTAVPHTSPSPIAACVSPTEKSAPSTPTGRYRVVPARRCLMSRLPPQVDGGTIECSPGSGSATPIVPGNGSNGSVIPSAKRTRRVSASTCEMRSHGSGYSSARSPNPGMIAVQPQSPGRSSRISTASTSPGFAPFTATGPLTGFTCEKSRFVTASTVESLPICSSPASRTWNSTSAPESTSSTGSIALSQT